jgi:beta-xylosidase
VFVNSEATVAQTVRNYNPIIPDLIADPSIVKFGDTFYCYATTDGYDKGLATSGPPVLWQSKDLVNWSFDGIFFPSAAKQLFGHQVMLKK